MARPASGAVLASSASANAAASRIAVSMPMAKCGGGAAVFVGISGRAAVADLKPAAGDTGGNLVPTSAGRRLG
jgi:hypothetical protein